MPYAGLRDRILLSQGSEGAYDVILMDVIWIAEFAKRNMIVDVTDRVDSSLRSQVFDGAWQTADFGGKLYGFPWLVDAKFMYDNTKMLADAGFSAPPKTIDELVAQAKAIKDKGSSNTRSSGTGARTKRSSATSPSCSRRRAEILRR